MKKQENVTPNQRKKAAAANNNFEWIRYCDEQTNTVKHLIKCVLEPEGKQMCDESVGGNSGEGLYIEIVDLQCSIREIKIHRIDLTKECRWQRNHQTWK